VADDTGPLLNLRAGR